MHRLRQGRQQVYISYDLPPAQYPVMQYTELWSHLLVTVRQTPLVPKIGNRRASVYTAAPRHDLRHSGCDLGGCCRDNCRTVLSGAVTCLIACIWTSPISAVRGRWYSAASPAEGYISVAYLNPQPSPPQPINPRAQVAKPPRIEPPYRDMSKSLTSLLVRGGRAHSGRCPGTEAALRRHEPNECAASLGGGRVVLPRGFAWSRHRDAALCLTEAAPW